MHDPVAISLVALWGASILAVIVIVIRELRRPTMAPLPDPAFREDPVLRADDQWAGIECEWHEFVDAFGVREAQR